MNINSKKIILSTHFQTVLLQKCTLEAYIMLIPAMANQRSANDVKHINNCIKPARPA
jgi:hypothetical protein